jgi:phage terminase small subunit
MKSTKIEPPAGLNAAGQKLWNAIEAEYDIRDSGGLALLESACRAEDDIVNFRRIVAEAGSMIMDRFGQLKPHPLLASIRDCESTKRQALKALHLDVTSEAGGRAK